MSTPPTFSSEREEDIYFFVGMWREFVDLLTRWNLRLVRYPWISPEMSDSLRIFKRQDWKQFTSLHDEMQEWIESDAEREGWNDCWWTKVHRIEEFIQTLARDLQDPPAHYHHAELAERLSILVVCIGQLHYEKEVDDYVRQMRNAAQEMNHRRITRGCYGPHLAAVWDELYEVMHCECQFCWEG
jgi:glycine/D-amino acid oxidase-like deaminating enzyme